MGGPCRTWDPTCTPWILFDMSLPMEAADRHPEGCFRTVISKPESFPTPRSSKGMMAKKKSQDDNIGFSPLPVTISTRYDEFTDFKTFQEEYPLKNAKGEDMYEHELLDTAEQAYWWRRITNCTCFWAVLLTVAYAMPRLVSSSCFDKYRSLLVTQRYCERHNMTFSPE